jgi:hypothetical protein
LQINGKINAEISQGIRRLIRIHLGIEMPLMRHISKSLQIEMWRCCLIDTTSSTYSLISPRVAKNIPKLDY